MHIPPLLAILLTASLAETVLSLRLSQRQIAHVQGHRDIIPADFAQSVSAQEHREAADYYTATRERLVTLRAIWQWRVGAA